MPASRDKRSLIYNAMDRRLDTRLDIAATPAIIHCGRLVAQRHVLVDAMSFHEAAFTNCGPRAPLKIKPPTDNARELLQHWRLVNTEEDTGVPVSLFPGSYLTSDMRLTSAQLSTRSLPAR